MRDGDFSPRTAFPEPPFHNGDTISVPVCRFVFNRPTLGGVLIVN